MPLISHGGDLSVIKGNYIAGLFLGLKSGYLRRLCHLGDYAESGASDSCGGKFRRRRRQLIFGGTEIKRGYKAAVSNSCFFKIAYYFAVGDICISRHFDTQHGI